MEKLLVAPSGAPVVDTSTSTAVGMRVPDPVRMVSALPVWGRQLVPATVTQGVVQVEATLEVPFSPPPGFVDVTPVGRSGQPGGPVVVRGGRDQVYISRLVWATPDAA